MHYSIARLVVCLLAGVAVCGPARAGEVVANSPAASKLRWHARGVPLKEIPPAAEKVAEKVPAKVDELAPVVTPAVAKLPIDKKSPRQLSTRTTRSRLRDSIMQVGASSDQEPKEELPESAPSTQTPKLDAEMPERAIEDEPRTPANRAATEPEPEPLRSSVDPFADEPIPPPPSSAQPPSSDELSPDDLSQGISTPPGDTSCKGYGAECLKAIRDLQRRDISQIVVGLVIEGVEGEDFPCDCQLGDNVDAPTFVGRNFSRTCFNWTATGVCHKPLYFEDVQLERYGHSWNPVLQPFMSAGHFFVSVPLLPYKMGLNLPNECMYSLGYYRPGDCAPYLIEPVPLSLRAAIFQGLGATGFAFWFWPG